MPIGAERKIAWKWRRREENDRVDCARSFSPEFGDQGEGVGEDSRTTTDFELDSDRAWNSILDSAAHVEWTKFEFVSSFRIRAWAGRTTCCVYLIPRSREFGSCPSLFYALQRMSHRMFYSLQILQPAQNWSFINEIPRHLHTNFKKPLISGQKLIACKLNQEKETIKLYLLISDQFHLHIYINLFLI